MELNNDGIDIGGMLNNPSVKPEDEDEEVKDKEPELDEDEEKDEDEHPSDDEDVKGPDDEDNGDDDDEEDEEEDEKDSDKGSNKAILAELRIMQRRLDSMENGSFKVEEKEDTPKLEVDAFVNADNFDEVMNTPEKVNEMLTGVAQVAYEKAIEHVIKRMPSVISAEVARTVTTQTMVQDFYRTNKDLIPHKRYVAMAYEELRESDPTLTMEDLFIKGKLAKEVRKTLGIRRPESGKGRQRTSAPAGRGKPGRSKREKGKESSIGQQISDMLKI